MFKQALSFFLFLSFFTLTGFTPQEKSEKWTATLTLEGISQQVILTSNAIYGGYNQVEKKFYFFGKDHMFMHATNPEYTKLFTDLCTYNGSGKFSFEINQVSDPNPGSNPKTCQGNISFKKKFPIQGVFSQVKSGNEIEKAITAQGDLKLLGFTMTEEAQKVFSGKFKLVISSTR